MQTNAWGFAYGVKAVDLLKHNVYVSVSQAIMSSTVTNICHTFCTQKCWNAMQLLHGKSHCPFKWSGSLTYSLVSACVFVIWLSCHCCGSAALFKSLPVWNMGQSCLEFLSQRCPDVSKLHRVLRYFCCFWNKVNDDWIRFAATVCQVQMHRQDV